MIANRLSDIGAEHRVVNNAVVVNSAILLRHLRGQISERRTSVDTVFSHLYDEIVSMRLLPGSKISEAEIAGLFGISRQPVRDAFSRLENLDLLLIRPQKATEVKRFSSAAITTARFVRAAIEAEVLRRAARVCGDKGTKLLQDCLYEQRAAVAENDYDKQDSRLDILLEDHNLIAEGISNNDEEAAVAAGMQHLTRLDATINTIHKENVDYFDD